MADTRTNSAVRLLAAVFVALMLGIAASPAGAAGPMRTEVRSGKRAAEVLARA